MWVVTKVCAECEQELPLEEFYRNHKQRDGYVRRCKSCHRERYNVGRSDRAKKARGYFEQIKLERGCADCGYNANSAALDFDHLPEFVKLYRFCTMAGMRQELIDAEIAKCEVVCANCHRIRTVTRLRTRPYPTRGRSKGEGKGRTRIAVETTT
jgi:hypothetical protein